MPITNSLSTLDRVITFFFQINLDLVVLWIAEISNLKEFFSVYTLGDKMFKLTNENANFTQSANDSTLAESMSGCDWI